MGRTCSLQWHRQMACEVGISAILAAMLFAMPGGGFAQPAPAAAGGSDIITSAPAAGSAAEKALPSAPGEVPKNLEGEQAMEEQAVENEPTAALPEGDDKLPGAVDAENSPYLQPVAPGSLAEGQRLAPAAAPQTKQAAPDATGAFVPPTGTTKDESLERSDTATDLMNVLGEETFNRRVNITTPPDTEVAEVIRLLAERATLNFIYPEGVIKGRVTLNLRDVPLGVALQSLLSTHGLAMVREGENVMRILPRSQLDPTGQVEMKTISVKLNWIPAPTAEKTLEQFVKSSSRGSSIKSHADSNILIVTSSPNMISMIRDLITQIDVPEKQVMIEARMAELVIDNARQLGSQVIAERVDTSGNALDPTTLLPQTGWLGDNAAHTERRLTGVDTGKEDVEVAAKVVDRAISSLLVGGGAPSLSFGGVVSILGQDFDVSAVLDAMETRNIANVLANPRVITLNNQMAMIEILRDNPYIETQQGVAGDVVGQAVKFKESGISLKVLPNITNNGFVRMRIEPEQKILAGRTSTNVPIINKRTALTNVIVKDEDTVVIGGLRQIESADSKTQFPWLAQVPMLGWFFKKDSKLMAKNDLMLFVTPHIIKAPVMAPAENYKYNRIDAHWDLPDYFFDDSVEVREARHRGELDNSAKDRVPATLSLPPVEAATSADDAAATETGDTK